MRTNIRRMAILAGGALTVACVAIAPATVAQSAGAPATVTATLDAPATAIESADGADRSDRRRAVRVSGRQIPVDVGNGLYKMEGSMIGEWKYIPTAVLHQVSTLYVESGVEVFKGCIDRGRKDGRCTRRDINGELHLAFLYWASFDSDGGLIKGQCVHPITGGKGDFAGARGRLDMVDRPAGDEVVTTYRGRVVLNAEPDEKNAPTPPTSSTAGAATGLKTSASTGRRAC